MHRDCDFGKCDKEATVFYLLPKYSVSRQGYKSWFCPKHYNVMAAYYMGDRAPRDQWNAELLSLNGW